MKPRGTPPGGPPSPPPDPPGTEEEPPPKSGPFRHLAPGALGWLAAAYPWLVARAGRLGVPEHDAADVAQQTLIAAASSWYSYRKDASRRAWLWGVLVNSAADYRRRVQKVRALAAAAKEPLMVPAPAADAPVLVADAVRHLQAATTPERWSAFWATAVDGDSASEYARRKGLTPNTVANLVRLAREDLRAAIARENAVAAGPLVHRAPRSKP